MSTISGLYLWRTEEQLAPVSFKMVISAIMVGLKHLTVRTVGSFAITAEPIAVNIYYNSIIINHRTTATNFRLACLIDTIAVMPIVATIAAGTAAAPQLHRSLLLLPNSLADREFHPHHSYLRKLV